ncbi:MAG: biotin synthase BioB [Planctomycetaceae bacterium]|nr:biotin synthase BioB [Planctomycetaceae bacterium]
MIQTSATISASQATSWHELADRVLSGHQTTAEEALAILRAPDVELLDILSAAYKIRHRYFANTVQLYFLMNAKSGLCPEDCTYCSQSKDSEAEIPKYNFLSRDKILEGARIAHERNSKTYCMVISSRGPTEREIAAVEQLVPQIKEQYDLKICACLGLLTPADAQRLKACGVDRVNHNVNTSPEHYKEICSTHTYEDRIETLQAVRDAGIEVCSGGIIGMGEQDTDVVQMACELREVGAESIPLNFLIPIEGATITATNKLTPRYCLKALAMFRFVNPARELRIAGGRELHLGSMQCLGLYPANSVFVGDYLTTEGQVAEADYKMIDEMGFVVTRNEECVVR